MAIQIYFQKVFIKVNNWHMTYQLNTKDYLQCDETCLFSSSLFHYSAHFPASTKCKQQSIETARNYNDVECLEKEHSFLLLRDACKPGR